MSKLYKNILSKKEQNNLLKFIKSNLKVLEVVQTSPDLHLYDEMKPLDRLKIPQRLFYYKMLIKSKWWWIIFFAYTHKTI